MPIADKSVIVVGIQVKSLKTPSTSATTPIHHSSCFPVTLGLRVRLQPDVVHGFNRHRHRHLRPVQQNTSLKVVLSGDT